MSSRRRRRRRCALRLGRGRPLGCWWDAMISLWLRQSWRKVWYLLIKGEYSAHEIQWRRLVATVELTHCVAMHPLKGLETHEYWLVLTCRISPHALAFHSLSTILLTSLPAEIGLGYAYASSTVTFLYPLLVKQSAVEAPQVPPPMMRTFDLCVNRVCIVT